jgi:beta-phosphoglucomutase family hydrolase
MIEASPWAGRRGLPPSRPDYPTFTPGADAGDGAASTAGSGRETRARAPAPGKRLALGLRRLGLDAILFDLDGVVTRTASLHARVWQRLFDEFLARRPASRPTTRNDRPFRLPEDYLAHVDGKPRVEGVRSFLRSRGQELPFGARSDDPDSDTVCGLCNRKTQLFMAALDSQGVEVFDGTVAFLCATRAAPLKTACVSSSFTCRKVLASVRLTDQFDIIYDGNDLDADGLPGKPQPDCFLRAAELLGIEPSNAAVVEDAVVGVAAGHAGGFRQVIAVDRGAGRQQLLDAGADLVVTDLAELLTA